MKAPPMNLMRALGFLFWGGGIIKQGSSLLKNFVFLMIVLEVEATILGDLNLDDLFGDCGSSIVCRKRGFV